MEAAKRLVAISLGGRMSIVNFQKKRKQAERTKYKDMVLAAFDSLMPKAQQEQQAGKPQRLDTDPEVRRKAKQQL